jgi:hypothetical protein
MAAKQANASSFRSMHRLTTYMQLQDDHSSLSYLDRHHRSVLRMDFQSTGRNTMPLGYPTRKNSTNHFSRQSCHTCLRFNVTLKFFKPLLAYFHRTKTGAMEEALLN